MKFKKGDRVRLTAQAIRNGCLPVSKGALVGSKRTAETIGIIVHDDIPIVQWSGIKKTKTYSEDYLEIVEAE